MTDRKHEGKESMAVTLKENFGILLGYVGCMEQLEFMAFEFHDLVCWLRSVVYEHAPLKLLGNLPAFRLLLSLRLASCFILPPYTPNLLRDFNERLPVLNHNSHLPLHGPRSNPLNMVKRLADQESPLIDFDHFIVVSLNPFRKC